MGTASFEEGIAKDIAKDIACFVALNVNEIIESGFITIHVRGRVRVRVRGDRDHDDYHDDRSRGSTHFISVVNFHKKLFTS